MKKQNKKINKNVITFQNGDDYTALALAKLGMSNVCIQARTTLTGNQISYRLSKAKRTEETQFGYRVAFRNGVSPAAVQVISDMAKVIQADIMRNVVPKIVHPTPQTVRIKE